MATFKNLARDRSSTVGPDAITLSGTAIPGYFTFANSFSNGNAVRYKIINLNSPTEVEVGEGIYNAGTLTRDTVFRSSNANALVTFSGGALLDVWNVQTAEEVVALNVANVFTAGQTISSTTPFLVLTDTTASAKGLTIAVDANLAQLRESAGGSGSLLVLDLANAWVGIRTAAPKTILHLDDSTSRTAFTGTGVGSLLIRETNGTTHYATLDFSASGSTSGIAQSRIASLQTANGSNLVFGTSNSYGSGITNSAITIDHVGKVGILMTPAKTLDITGTFGVTGIATFGAPATLKGYTVATLPAGVQGHVVFVTDALAPTFGAALVGGGAVVRTAFYNGTAWVA